MDNYTENDVEKANKALQLMGYVAKVVNEPPSHLDSERRLVVLIQQRKYPISIGSSSTSILLSSDIRKLSWLCMEPDVKALVDRILDSLPSALLIITPEIADAVLKLVQSHFLNASFTGENNIALLNHDILDRLRHPHCFPTLRFLLEMQDYILDRQLLKCSCTYCNTSVGFGVVCSCGACAHFDCVRQLLSHEDNLSCLICATAWPAPYIAYIHDNIKYS
ncbi:Hypothetical protein GLP15_3874 [Giardia lamblia P15]|uniref:Uncharacterized protein n=1 Tax=Giardia intestinalis (strain P15) TaxID=658858 RepID=E1F1A0_GIAIA|nr:Hypothetical protein GLP15_3874 [Giardia lamblia P15]